MNNDKIMTLGINQARKTMNANKGGPFGAVITDKKGNIRDYASINELICLSNMENINAVLIEDGLSQKERLIKLNKIAMAKRCLTQ